jgi:hypothetical protein
MNTERDWEAIAARLETEDPLPVTRAAKLCKVDNRRGHCSANAVVGWILRGKKGVFLDGYRGAGKAWWTSAAAIRRFYAALSAAEADRSRRARKQPETVPFDSPAARHREAEKAKEKLRAMGVKC